MPSNKPPPAPPAPRLYLATQPVEDAAALAPLLDELLAVADVAAVLVRLAEADDRSKINRVKALAASIQKPGAALLLDGHVELVARAGADGTHVNGIEPMHDALEQLKPDRIVGVGGLHSRHNSMVAGEAGADYLLFGEVDTDGRRPSTEAIAERLEWWAELFEIPMRRLCTNRGRGRAVRVRRCGLHHGGRRHLAGRARSENGAPGCGRTSPTGSCSERQESRGKARMTRNR